MNWRSTTAEDRTIAALWGISAAVALAMAPVWRFAPLVLPGCLWHAWTGFPCPACGTTRAALSLLAGHPLRALAWNPLAAIAGIAFVLGGAIAPAWVFLGRRVPSGLARVLSMPKGRAAAITAVAANWLYLVWAGV